MSDLPSTTANAHSQARLGWVLGLTSMAYFMVVIDAVVVITALPRMQRDLKVSLSSLQWTRNAYGISFAAGIITAAALGDRFGRRRVFNLGLALFTIASAACALAPDASAAMMLPGALPALVRRASATRPVLAVPQCHTCPASMLTSPPRPGHNQKGGITAERGTSTPHTTTGSNSSSYGCPEAGPRDQGA
jgi:Major Facilitator Superfamily